jgi:hypothetical protein
MLAVGKSVKATQKENRHFGIRYKNITKVVL